MTMPRLLAIGFIFVCTAAGWFVLGGSVIVRSGERDAALAERVAELWGGPQTQTAPTLWLEVPSTATETVSEERDGRTVTRRVERPVTVRRPLPLAASRIDVGLALEHRRKGLLWYDTYTVDFAGRYRARVPADAGEGGEVVTAARFAFPSATGLYDDFHLRLNGAEVGPTEDLSQGLEVRRSLAPGSEVELEIAYASRGLDRWTYELGPGPIAEARDFALAVTTDFAAVDFPPGTLSPTAKRREGEGWRLDWAFERLVSGQSIGVDLPNKPNPGPLAARITFFAPVSLLFFLAVFVVLGALRRVDLHPMNYFFLSAAFFAFHLLLAYLVDHLSIHLAFVVAAAVSVALVAGYLRLVPGARHAVGLAVAAQVVYLVLFSFAFFFRGYTGLTVTVGAVVTLFVLMQATGRVDWGEALCPAREQEAVTGR